MTIEIILGIVIILLVVIIIAFLIYIVKQKSFAKNSSNKLIPNQDFEFQTETKEKLDGVLDDLKKFNYNGIKTNRKDFEFQTITKEKLDGVLNDLKKLSYTGATTNQKILNVEEKIYEINNLFRSTKKRGILGEALLNKILESAFSQNKSLYQTQYKIDEHRIVDAIIFAPNNNTNIVIDSKFSYDNFVNRYDSRGNEIPSWTSKGLINDLKKRIKECAKYINKAQNIYYSFMFIPSEAIYHYIINYLDKLVQEAENQKVFIVGPTTLSPILISLYTIFNNYKREKNTDKIIEGLEYLAKEFQNWDERFQIFVKAYVKLGDTTNKLKITNQKISRKFVDVQKIE